MPRAKRPSNIDIHRAVSNIRRHLKNGDLRNARTSTQKLLSYLSFLGLLTNAPESSLIPGLSDHSSEHPAAEEKVIPPRP